MQEMDSSNQVPFEEQEQLNTDIVSEKELNRISWGALLFPAIWALKYKAWSWAILFLTLTAILIAAGIANAVVAERSNEVMDRWFEVIEERSAIGSTGDQWPYDREILDAKSDALWEEVEAFHPYMTVLSIASSITAFAYFVVSIFFALKANRIVWNQHTKQSCISQGARQAFSRNQRPWVIAWVAWQISMALLLVVHMNFPGLIPGWTSQFVVHLSATPVMISSLYGAVFSIVFAITTRGEPIDFLLAFMTPLLLLITYGIYTVLYLRDRKQKKISEV